MIRRPPSATRNAILLPSSTLVRSGDGNQQAVVLVVVARRTGGERDRAGGAARGGASDLGRVDDLGESAGAQRRAIGRRRAGGAGAGEVDAERQHRVGAGVDLFVGAEIRAVVVERSEEHTSELQSLMRISYAVFCL